MDITSFNTLVDNPLLFSFQDKVLVQEECVKTPYSAVLRLLDTLGSKACKIAADKLYNPQMTSLFLPTTSTLAGFLERVQLKEVLASRVEPKPTAPLHQAKATPAPSESDILKEINDYQEISFKTAPKSVILDKFLETAAYHDVDDAPIDPVAVSESGKKSLQPDNSLITETLALILEQQGKYEKAIEVYEKLSALNPEKSATFAARIEEIKTKINN